MNRKIKVGLIVVLLISFSVGGIYWKFNKAANTPKIVRYDFFNLEELLESDLEDRKFEKVQSVLNNVGPHVKQSQSLIDQYIYEYYTTRIQIDSMTNQITDLNQFFYRMNVVKRRLEEIKGLMFKEKADITFRRHWGEKIDGLLVKVQKKQDEFAGYMKNVRNPAQKSQ